MLPSLAVAGVVNLVAGTVFALVGARYVPRRTSTQSALANQAFATYWIAFGAYTSIDGALDLLAAFDRATFSFYLLMRYVTLPIMILAVGSVTFYFAFLLTGRQSLAMPIAAFFAFVLVGMTVHVASNDPYAVAIGAWDTDLAYRGEYEGSSFFAFILLAIALPPVIGAIVYLWLARRIDDPRARRRVRLVGSGILLWSFSAVVARLATDSDLMQFLSRPVLGCVIAATILFAYYPDARPERDPLLDDAKKRALDARLHQLL